MSGQLVAFLGPSLPRAAARRAAPGVVLLPPAARGDVWAALARRPRAIALIDGVFESQPAVWPRELLAALEGGVAVFGAASMGALRAVELAPFGMVGLGQVVGWLRDGTVRDDSEVALLHAGAEHGYRPLTVALVQVRAVAALAVRQRHLRPSEARRLLGAAQGVFYQERTWPKVLAAAAFDERARARFADFQSQGLPDPKAEDARICLQAAAAFVGSPNSPAPRRPLWPAPSVLVQRRLRGQPLAQPPGRALLAALGRSLGLREPSGFEPPLRQGNPADAARQRADAELAESLQRVGPRLIGGLWPTPEAAEDFRDKLPKRVGKSGAPRGG